MKNFICVFLVVFSIVGCDKPKDITTKKEPAVIHNEQIPMPPTNLKNTGTSKY